MFHIFRIIFDDSPSSFDSLWSEASKANVDSSPLHMAAERGLDEIAMTMVHRGGP